MEIFNYLRKKSLCKFTLLSITFAADLKNGFKTGMYPNAESYAKEALSIPIYPDLEKIENFIKILKNFIS